MYDSKVIINSSRTKELVIIWPRWGH